MAYKYFPYDYSSLKKKTVNKYCYVEVKNCLSVPNMLLKLGGHNTKYQFIDDAAIAKCVYDHAVEEMREIGERNDVYAFDHADEITYEAWIAVIKYKSATLRTSRLTTLAAIKIQPFTGCDHHLKHLTFVRYFKLPCKFLRNKYHLYSSKRF